jgi:glycyl-tRNA synthetase beta chain
MGAGLASVTFHNKLGSQADRVARIAALAAEIAPMVGADAELAAAAARVAKADLQSAMVGEFPELQGTMGGYYARAAGLDEAVALACKAHYAPLGPTDAVPTDPVSVAVALADKIDTLTGFWAIDEKPTGSKDPFALRRAALGAIRLMLGNGVRVGLSIPISFAGLSNLFDCVASRKISFLAGEVDGDEFWETGINVWVGPNDDDYLLRTRSEIETYASEGELSFDLGANRLTTLGAYSTDLLTFFHDRLKVFLRDEGIRHDIIDACIAMPGNDDLTLLVNRARALNAFITSDDGTNLLQGFKRANNILTQAEAKDNVEYSYGADIKFAETDVERALFHALDIAEATIAPAMKVEDFATAMAALANLRAPIDAFFNTVQVNAENDIIRRNRLNLLHRIRAACAPVADLTKIEG